MIVPDAAMQNQVVSSCGAYESILDDFAISQIDILASRASVSIRL